MPFDLYLEQICVSDMRKFVIFYHNSIEKFYATKYVTDFFGMPIDKIIDALELYNNIYECPSVIKSWHNYSAIKNIINVSTTIKLTYIVYCAKIIIDNDLKVFATVYGDYFVQNYMTILAELATRTDQSINKALGITIKNNHIRTNKSSQASAIMRLLKVKKFDSNYQPILSEVVKYFTILYDDIKIIHNTFIGKKLDQLHYLTQINAYHDVDAIIYTYYFGEHVEHKSMYLYDNLYLINMITNTDIDTSEPLDNLQSSIIIIDPNMELCIDI